MVWKVAIAFKLTHPVSVPWAWFGWGYLLTLMRLRCCLSFEPLLEILFQLGGGAYPLLETLARSPQPHPHILEVAKPWQLLLPLLRSQGGTHGLLLTKAFPESFPGYLLRQQSIFLRLQDVSENGWYFDSSFLNAPFAHGVKRHTTHSLYHYLLLLSLAITF